MYPPGAFPSVHVVSRLVENSARAVVSYDIKFFPYLDPEIDTIFAVLFGSQVLVCRPKDDKNDPLDVLQAFCDPKEDILLNSLAWSIDGADPLICFAGSSSGNIRVANVITGKFVRNLSGHGGAINDLAISPLSPTILASASNDHTVRLWNLDLEYAHQPLAAIFAGAGGHREHILTISFHQTGTYLLSASADAVINVWLVPSVPDENAGTDNTTKVEYPHFSSNEIHGDYVDCVRFYGDIILSHAATTSGNETRRPNAILLWRIDGFNSADPPPVDAPIPGTAQSFTRSAWGGSFQRLLTFDMPDTVPFYLRFSLFENMLAMGNTKSKLSFWDLAKIETGPQLEDVVRTRRGTRGGRGRVSGLGRVTSSLGKAAQRQKQDEEMEDVDVDESESMSVSTASRSKVASATPGPASTSANSVADDGSPLTTDPRFDTSDPFRPIPPHHTVTVPKYNFTIRQCAWSNDGKWMIGVGEEIDPFVVRSNVIAILKREEVVELD